MAKVWFGPFECRQVSGGYWQLMDETSGGLRFSVLYATLALLKEAYREGRIKWVGSRSDGVESRQGVSSAPSTSSAGACPVGEGVDCYE